MNWKRRVVDRLLCRLAPSGTALLDSLGPRISDSLLMQIAVADYGLWKDENFAALRPIRDRQRIPISLHWLHGEVLALTKWIEPDEFPPWLNSKIIRGHLKRAFSCAVLLKAADNPDSWVNPGEENQTLIHSLVLPAIPPTPHGAVSGAARIVGVVARGSGADCSNR